MDKKISWIVVFISLTLCIVLVSSGHTHGEQKQEVKADRQVKPEKDTSICNGLFN